MCCNCVFIVVKEGLEQGKNDLDKTYINNKETNHTLVKVTALILVNFLGFI